MDWFNILMKTFFMKYSNYRVDDFLTDEFFRTWVIRPDDEADFFWSSFLKNNPEKYNAVLGAKEIILSIESGSKSNERLSQHETEIMFHNILNEKERSTLSAKERMILGSGRFTSRLIKVAAVIFITAFVGIYWFIAQHNVSSTTTFVDKSITKETFFGEKMTMRLPDNSVVVLNSGSRIEYPSTFPNNERRISLQGEAFFDVTEDREKPFIVETDQFYTKVLGTSFVILRDKELNTMNVSVLHGKVEVTHVSDENELEKIQLIAEQKTSFEEDEFKRKPFDYMTEFAWKDGTLYFNNADFNGIVKILEDWYGVNITINKSIDRHRDFSGQFTNESLDLVLDGLSFTYDFDYQINGKNININ